MKPSKEQENRAAFFDALGHKRRQMICDILIQHGQKGLPFEMLQHKSKLAASTLSHHLAKMQTGGVLRRKEKGRETWLSVDLSQITRLPAHYAKTTGQKKGHTNGAALPISQ